MKTKSLPFLPYLKVFAAKKGSDRVHVYFRDPIMKVDIPFVSLEDHPVHLSAGRYPDAFYQEYARRLVHMTEQRMRLLLNGNLPKGATGVLEMAVMGGMGKEELARMISRIAVKEDAP